MNKDAVQSGLWRRLCEWVLLCGLCSLGVAPAWAVDDPPGRVARVAELTGQAWVRPSGQDQWQVLSRNWPVTPGDELRTDRDTRLTLHLGSSTLRVDVDSNLWLRRLDDQQIELQLEVGSLALRVRHAEVAAEWQLSTAEGRLRVRSPGLFRLDRSATGTAVSVLEGELGFEIDGGATLGLQPHQRAEISPTTGPGTGPSLVWMGLAGDVFERWVRQTDAEEPVLPVATTAPVSPEMTGAAELDRHGHWERHPSYGDVWYPTAVAVGWAPYRWGRWIWVSPWGWTWLDDASWGFAPFHHGRWFYWRNRWYWAPGPIMRRPVYAPAMVAWVDTRVPHRSSSPPAGPAVAWVPLAPTDVYRPSYSASPSHVQAINPTWAVAQPPAGKRPVVPPQQVSAPANRNAPGGLTLWPTSALTPGPAPMPAVLPPNTRVRPAVPPPRPSSLPVVPDKPAPAQGRAVPWRPTYEAPRPALQPATAWPGTGAEDALPHNRPTVELNPALQRSRERETSPLHTLTPSAPATPVAPAPGRTVLPAPRPVNAQPPAPPALPPAVHMPRPPAQREANLPERAQPPARRAQPEPRDSNKAEVKKERDKDQR